MAGTIKMFCIRKNICSHRKNHLLFLPCNMTAVQNLYARICCLLKWRRNVGAWLLVSKGSNQAPIFRPSAILLAENSTNNWVVETLIPASLHSLQRVGLNKRFLPRPKPVFSDHSFQFSVPPHPPGMRLSNTTGI